MSRTFSLVCEETKQKLWIGQGRSDNPFYLYTGDAEVMKKLSLFFRETIGKNLEVMDDEGIDSDITEFME
jgi:hypothetical protein